MCFADKSLDGVLQHLPANHEEEVSRVYIITYASVTVERENHIVYRYREAL